MEPPDRFIFNGAQRAFVPKQIKTIEKHSKSKASFFPECERL